MDFLGREDVDGIRFSWNNVPKSKLQHQRNVVPLAALYTPLNNKAAIPTYPDHVAVRCRQCKAFAHPYVSLHLQSGNWQCSFCMFHNTIPQVQPGAGHPAVDPHHTTMEFRTDRRAPLAPVFVYVVDTCFEGDDVEDAFDALRASLVDSLALLPADALVGLVSFGRHVLLHDLSAPHRSVVFNGNKQYTLDAVQTAFGLEVPGITGNGTLGSVAQRYLGRVDLVEYQLTSIIELVLNNTFPHADTHRPARATGAAMNVVALTLLALFGRNTMAGGHILCFIGGAATVGPGRVVDRPKKEPLRSHHDIEKAKAAQLPNISSGVAKVNPLLWNDAKTFYADVADVLSATGLAMNLFIGSYDQAGLHEMAVVCARTGGSVVMCDSFSTTLFKTSLIKFFARRGDAEYPEATQLLQADDGGFLQMGFNASLECRTSRDLQIQGLIGHATTLPMRKDPTDSPVSPVVVGEGNTNVWKLCSVNPQSTYGVYLDKLDSPNVGRTYVQFTFHYQHPSGEYRIRVTTCALGVIPDADGAALLYGFDSEAALVAIARSQIEKLCAPGKSKWMLAFDIADLNKHLDKLLVDYCSQFAHYTKGDPTSFTIYDKYFDLACKMYHLRRSPFIRVFNSSPDETSFYHHVLMHEDVVNSVIMIKPSLLCYDMDTFGQPDAAGNQSTDPVAVELDLSSLGKQRILLLDTFFQILIYHGLTIAQWKKMNYQNQEGYEHFRDFLDAPKIEALYILADRFPLPRFIDCDEGGSQARFLIARLNSSTSYSSNPQFDGRDILTDDASLAEFMDRLKRNIVGSKL
ncbi:vWA-like protein [Metschnikowia bicuspidata]|uniref:Protein transport protein SEC23 n=1 Tax=Metschnikowia bicuspidata TaxID=27322 RepID=A0A4P9ZEC3_9ASCO|nr:vWA-like protein [Metschnikowia bicuspidata]